MEDDNTAPSILVGVPTTNLPSTQIQNDNSNKKMLIIGTMADKEHKPLFNCRNYLEV